MYDHAQSPRLGQRTPVENPGVQLVSTLSLPEIAYRGQIVYALDIDEFRVFDGVAWQVPTGGTTGPTGSQVFVGPDEPVADAIGDTWLNTTNYQLYVWDGTTWQFTTSTQDQIYTRSSLKLAAALLRFTGTLNALVTIYYDSVPPSAGMVAHDFWCNTANNQVYQYEASAWTRISDTTIEADINAAGMDRYTLDGLIEIYFDSVAPTGLDINDIGDLWVDTGHSNLVRGWTGAQWIILQVTADDIAPGAVGDTQLDPTVSSTINNAAPQSSLDEAILDINAHFDQVQADIISGDSANSADIANAITDFNAGLATKITTFRQAAEPPTTDRVVGDLWYDSDDGDRLYRWSGTAWDDVRDDGIAAASSSAAAAQTTANNALTAAQAAQATADGAIRTYYQSDPPWANGSTQPDSVLGDMWFDLDDGQAYRWNGTSWQIIEDSSIAAALAAAQNAQTTADGKITSFYATGAPATADVGDLWFDTDDKNKPYYWNGSVWVSLRDGTINDAQIAADAALTAANGKNKVTHSTNSPGATSNTAGDIWFQHADSSLNKVIAQWRGTGGTGWVQVAFDPVIIPQIDIGAGTFGSLDGVRLTARTVAASKVIVTDYRNYAQNPGAEDGVVDPHVAISGTTFTAVTNPTRSGLRGFRLGLSSAIAGNAYVVYVNGTRFDKTSKMPVQPGDVVRAEVWVRIGTVSGSTTASVFFDKLDGTGTLISNTTGTAPSGFVRSATLTTAYQQLVSEYVVPSDGTMYVGMAIAMGAAAATDVMHFDDLLFRKKLGGQLIVDGSITTNNLAADAVTAAVIKAGTITADRVAIGMSGNLIDNGDAGETPSRRTTYPQNGVWWQYWDDSATGYGHTHSGTKMFLVNTMGNPGWPYSQFAGQIPVQPGEVYTLAYWSKRWNNCNTPVSVQFFGYAGDGTYTGNPDIGSLQTSTSDPNGTWVRKTLLFTIPSDTYYLTPTLSIRSGTAGNEVWFLDDITLQKSVTGELIVDGAIDAKTITGSTIRTSGTATTNGVVLDSTGLKGYKAGVNTFSVDSSGTVSMVGTIKTGSGNTYISIDSSLNRIMMVDGGVTTAYITSSTYSGQTFFSIKSGSNNISINSSGGIGLTGPTWIKGGLTVGDPAIPGIGVIQTFDAGNTTTNTNASGQVVVNHGCGVQPSRILITGKNPNARFYAVTARSATTFTVTVWNSSGALVTSAASGFDWIALS